MPSFLEKWAFGFLSAVKGKEAAERHRRRLGNPNRIRFESHMSLVVGSFMILAIVIGAILTLAIQLT